MGEGEGEDEGEGEGVDEGVGEGGVRVRLRYFIIEKGGRKGE